MPSPRARAPGPILLALARVGTACAVAGLVAPAARAGLTSELVLLAGYSSTSVPAGSATPLLLQGGGGVALGWSPASGAFAVTATTDFRVINHYSGFSPQVGNRRGLRWNAVSPGLAIPIGRFTLRGDAQLFGDYQLLNPTDDGAALSYGKPMGFRGGILYRAFGRTSLGAYYESVGFSTQILSPGGVTELAEKLTLWQAGLWLVIPLTGGAAPAPGRAP